MAKTLYEELKRIGIDEALAHQLDKSLDPEHVATKQDLVVMQETILQVQFRTENAIGDLRDELRDMRGEIKDIRGEIKVVEAGLKLEVAAISRQFWITFGGLITTILSVYLVNWYFHTLT